MKRNGKLYFCKWPPTWIFIVLLVLLSACSDAFEEPTPVLPPPAIGTPATPVQATEDAQAAATPTAVPVTREATPTLAPTMTVTAVATTATDPSIQTVTVGPLPATTRDLLFIADGSLKLWQQQQRLVDVLLASTAATGGDEERTLPRALVGDVTGYSVSEDGRTAVVARVTRRETIIETLEGTEAMATLDDQRYELLWLNLDNGESHVLAGDVPNLDAFVLSPDGRTLAYSAIADIARPETTSQLFLLGTGSGEMPRALAACTGRCFRIAWHPENNLVVWGDTQALWLYNQAATRPESLLANTTDTPEGTAVYSPIAWAANGRYLLLWKSHFEGGSRAVFDVPTGQVIDVPDSLVYVDPFPAEIVWMPDDRLYVLRSQDEGQLRPMAELWRVSLDSGQLVLEESRRLSDQPLYATAPRHLLDGRFAYALVGATPVDGSGLYILTALAENETPERVNAVLPAPAAPDIHWSPDGAGAVIAQEGSVFYAPAGNDSLYNVQPVLGQLVHAVTWLPERTSP